jgi:exopolysaccharide biosynthesis polyprenyl glycosylphosphotransferase
MPPSLVLDAKARSARATRWATDLSRLPEAQTSGSSTAALRSSAYAVSKRVLDIVLSAAALIAAAPLMALIALAIRLESKGPILFKQRRVGIGGRQFWMYKFRTMVDNAESLKSRIQHRNQYNDKKFFKVKEDPRVTPFGRFLRRTSLDEFPQFWNVLRGEMSLVGPRPPVPEEVAHYAEHHYRRLEVTPGISGLWQVSGRSSVMDFEEVVQLDCEYIATRSLSGDLVILAKTIPAILRRNGAA